MLRWFEEGGNNSDVVISSRVRLARNINGYNFSYKMSDTDAKKLVKNVTDQLKTVSPISGYNSYNFDYLDAYQKMGMRERHVISPYPDLWAWVWECRQEQVSWALHLRQISARWR